MHFTYAVNLNASTLMQGDVLRRTPAIESILSEVHPYFQSNIKNQYFMILTQSCDLVRRTGSECKSPYITIAPVRSIDDVLSRQIKRLESDLGINAELPILTDKSKVKLTEFLQRLHNNNEPGYFFLEAEGTDLENDCCTFLNLSIALKAREHYDQCLEAKCIELESSFQAKLGWLVGQLYSRVGTEDWPQERLREKIKAATTDLAIWVPDSKLKPLVEQTRNNQGAPLNATEVKAMLRRIPDRKTQVMEQVSQIIDDAVDPQDDQHRRLAEKLKKRLKSDPALANLLR